MEMRIAIGVLVVAVIIGGYVFVTGAQNVGGPGDLGGATLSAEDKSVCGITASVTEGPYYVPGAPALSDGNLNYDALPGSSLLIRGRVFEGLDDTKPLANAVIDIWQTDTNGSYHPNANGDVSRYSADDISLRGTVMTDEGGNYYFNTIYPGEYTGRTRHIHIKVQAPGHDELTTQLILALPGDTISFDEDTVSQGLPNCHLLSLNATTPPTEARFDFRLAP
ncbi:MAG: hypothetical protein AAB573_03110 [Patescibacteria group bacterium]